MHHVHSWETLDESSIRCLRGLSSWQILCRVRSLRFRYVYVVRSGKIPRRGRPGLTLSHHKPAEPKPELRPFHPHEPEPGPHLCPSMWPSLTLIMFQGQGACKDCAAGTVSHVDINARRACVDCVGGFYMSEAGKQGCFECPGQKYSDDAANTDCKACAAGKVSAPGNQQCEDCPAGKSAPTEERLLYQLGETAQSRAITDVNTLCASCPAGKFKQAGVVGCSDCLAGTYSADQAPSCTDCQVGKIARNEGVSVCDDCTVRQE